MRRDRDEQGQHGGDAGQDDADRAEHFEHADDPQSVAPDRGHPARARLRRHAVVVQDVADTKTEKGKRQQRLEDPESKVRVHGSDRQEHRDRADDDTDGERGETDLSRSAPIHGSRVGVGDRFGLTHVAEVEDPT